MVGARLMIRFFILGRAAGIEGRPHATAATGDHQRDCLHMIFKKSFLPDGGSRPFELATLKHTKTAPKDSAKNNGLRDYVWGES